MFLLLFYPSSKPKLMRADMRVSAALYWSLYTEAINSIIIYGNIFVHLTFVPWYSYGISVWFNFLKRVGSPLLTHHWFRNHNTWQYFNKCRFYLHRFSLIIPNIHHGKTESDICKSDSRSAITKAPRIDCGLQILLHIILPFVNFLHCSIVPPYVCLNIFGDRYR